MLNLDRPRFTARETYTACIGRVQDPELKVRLDGVTEAVVNASAAFDTAATHAALHTIAQQESVGGTVTAHEMKAVYTGRMAKKRAPGRYIYDELITAPAQGRCPLCAHRQVTTLDHHLPKAYYPALAVVPLNLVPSCGECNKAKLDSVPATAADVSLHPYFDNIDGERWLQADVIESHPAVLRFHVEAPHAWTALTRQRVQNHFQSLGLAKLYSSEAAEELLNIRHQLVELYAVAGAGVVQLELEDRVLSCAAARRNGWRTAAYEAWAASDWFCNGGFAHSG